MFFSVLCELFLLLGVARGCPGSNGITPVWLESCQLSISISLLLLDSVLVGTGVLSHRAVSLTIKLQTVEDHRGDHATASQARAPGHDHLFCRIANCGPNAGPGWVKCFLPLGNKDGVNRPVAKLQSNPVARISAMITS